MSSSQTLDNRILKALGHPLRQRVLLHFHEGVSSPRAAAEALGERIGNVAYHTRILLDADCIELVRTEPRRGAVEHFYRATVRPWLTDDQWSRLPPKVRRGIFGDILATIQRDVTDAAEAGCFDDVETHVSRTRLQLDDQGWHDLAELLASTLDAAMHIQEASVARMIDGEPQTEAEPRRTELAMLHFNRAPSDERPTTQPTRRRAKRRPSRPAG